MKNLTRAEAAGFLLSHDDYRILTHRNPDGDTLGSAAALCLGLRSMGKKAHVLLSGENLGLCGFLLDDLGCDRTDEAGTFVAVDVAAANMLPRAFAHLADRIDLRIDHHGSGESFAREELVDPASASCAEIICDVLTILGIQLNRDMAEAVYVGASTDTGCFRYANTTAHTFMVAAVCTQAGADIAGLNRILFETNSLAKLRLQAWIVQNMRFFREGTLALVAIPRAVEDMLGVTDDDTANISSFARTVEGVCMAATLRQGKDGRTKISIRAVPGYDAAAVCGKFGGGGHKGAAGATISMDLEEAARAVEEAMLG